MFLNNRHCIDLIICGIPVVNVLLESFRSFYCLINWLSYSINIVVLSNHAFWSIHVIIEGNHFCNDGSLLAHVLNYILFFEVVFIILVLPNVCEHKPLSNFGQFTVIRIVYCFNHVCTENISSLNEIDTIILVLDI